MKPVSKQLRQLGATRTHLGEQRVRRGCTVAIASLRDKNGNASGQRILVPRQRRIQGRQFECVEPLAQDGLQRVFPARLDVELLPEMPGMIESARGLPRRGVLPAADLRLQR